MITATRLKERDLKKGYGLRSYVSASGQRYALGFPGTPAPWKILDNAEEENELREIDQFEIRSFDSVEELEELVLKEMEALARIGGSGVRAQILGTEGLKAPEGSAPPKRSADKVLKPPAIGEGRSGIESDFKAPLVNSGRKPAKPAKGKKKASKKTAGRKKSKKSE